MDVVSHVVEVTELVVGVSGNLEVVGVYEVDDSYLVKSKPPYVKDIGLLQTRNCQDSHDYTPKIPEYLVSLSRMHMPRNFKCIIVSRRRVK